jgi:microcystin-dependent protein
MPTFVVGSGVGDNYATILFPIIDVDWFKSALFGALFELTKSSNWVEMGDVSVSFAVEEAARMIDGYLFMNFNPFPVGLVLPYGSDTPPDAFLLCDGSDYATADYPELFSVVGYSFGGADDRFNVPSLSTRAVVGSGGGFDFGDVGGEIDHTLDTSEIPSHAHTIPLTATTLAVEPGEVTVLTPIPILTQDTGSTGGGAAHNNMPPFMALSYVIYAGRV